MITVVALICVTLVVCVALVCGTVVASKETAKPVNNDEIEALKEALERTHERITGVFHELSADVKELKTKANGESLKDGLKLK